MDGALDGRDGRFALMHFGVMDRGAPSLRLEIVPDSGEADLQGIRGTMRIDIRDGAHFYARDYTLPGA